MARSARQPVPAPLPLASRPRAPLASRRGAPGGRRRGAPGGREARGSGVAQGRGSRRGRGGAFRHHLLIGPGAKKKKRSSQLAVPRKEEEGEIQSQEERRGEEMALLSVSPSHHGIHPGRRSTRCICARVSPLRSEGERSRSRSRSRKDLALNVSSSSRAVVTCALKTPSYGKSKGEINPRDLFTFSYRFNSDIPMTETPGASIDEYLQNMPRIVGAVFPDKRKRTKISDEEWSVQLLPIQFLFLSASPVIVMRFVSKSDGKEYPPHVPVKASSLLLMEVTDYKLNGLDATPCRRNST
ncbi:hypothetical protein GUJ93_ZPchr0013g35411 [Zizania palustris]|uniref:Uncharacterized protein n=1 Tax=Zizania palustris TaxID=103762 RepID=A0A8J6C1N3_ZIZPA|nr:hypothetical protein GUJ93_ZPchr0013g35411 [Zizania palustris]